MSQNMKIKVSLQATIFESFFECMSDTARVHRLAFDLTVKKINFRFCTEKVDTQFRKNGFR